MRAAFNRSHRFAALAWVLCLLVFGPLRAVALEFVRQVISLPDNPRGWESWRMSDFADLDHDGLQDLLVICPGSSGMRLLIYRQRPGGFAAAPDESIDLPKDIYWIASVELDSQNGVQLVLASASGLTTLRTNVSRGTFETSPQSLIEVHQSFPGRVIPGFVTLTNRGGPDGVTLPFVTPERIVSYQRTNGETWKSEPPCPLDQVRSFWKPEEGQWAAGSIPARTLNIWDVFRTNVAGIARLAPKPENDAIKQLVHQMEESHLWHGVERADVDGDGREDVVVWQVVGDIDPRTDLFVFLRGEQIPAKPTQVLHCHGFPVVGPSYQVSPFYRLTPSASYQIVLLTIKTAAFSSRGLVDMLTTHGLDWALTIRTFRNGSFAQIPVAAIPLTSMMPEEKGASSLFWIDGDFNGDGRPDMLVRRSASQWDLILSKANGGWFDPRAAATLDIPPDSYFEARDLNHDGLDDLIVRNDPAEPARLTLFLSRPTAMGGKRK